MTGRSGAGSATTTLAAANESSATDSAGGSSIGRSSDLGGEAGNRPGAVAGRRIRSVMRGARRTTLIARPPPSPAPSPHQLFVDSIQAELRGGEERPIAERVDTPRNTVRRGVHRIES